MSSKDWKIKNLGSRKNVNYVAIVSDTDKTPASSRPEIEHYGGFLIAESVTLENAQYILKCVKEYESIRSENHPLTSVQIMYLKGIKSFNKEHGHTPSAAELGRHVGRCKHSALGMIQILEQKGYIKRVGKNKRLVLID